MAAVNTNVDHHLPRVWATHAGPCTVSNLSAFWPKRHLQLQHWGKQEWRQVYFSLYTPPPPPRVLPPSTGTSKWCHPLPPIDVVTSCSPGSMLAVPDMGHTFLTWMRPRFSICPWELHVSSQLGCKEDRDAITVKEITFYECSKNDLKSSNEDITGRCASPLYAIKLWTWPKTESSFMFSWYSEYDLHLGSSLVRYSETYKQ